MTANDIIIFNSLTNAEYSAIVLEAVKYSIISLPFTIDRMSIPNQIKRATNIAKGKIAEGLFQAYCQRNNIQADFNICATPFYQVDKRDFMLNGFEWDIKNNFIFTPHATYLDYINLPALIPNKHGRDQWSTRNNMKIAGSNGCKYLFTFMRLAPLVNNVRGAEFIEINLTNAQNIYLQNLYNKYQGIPQLIAPFSESHFWNNFGYYSNLFTLHDTPHLVITGYADNTNFNQFLDIGPYSDNNLINHRQPYWYQKVGSNNAISWLDGTLWAKINNKVTHVSNLIAF